MKIIVNKYLVPPGAIAWTIYPFIIFKDKKYVKDIYIRHERIHLAQQKELWVLPFFIMYIANFFWNLVRANPTPYRSIVFETEAFSKQLDKDYLKNRKRHAWRSFIKE